VERVALNAFEMHAALLLIIRAFGDYLTHRSEPDWHFQEKAIYFRTGMISVWIGCPVTSMSLSET
jgi:hypothetical protein